MKQPPILSLILVCFLAACMAIADTRTTFAIHDYLGVNWGPSVVTYHARFAPPVAEQELALTDAGGAPVLFQLANRQAENGRVAAADVRFLAAVAADKTAEYTLATGGAKAAPTGVPVTVRKEGGMLELANGLYRVRLPVETQTIYRSPVAANLVPGPIQAVQLPDGTWAGKSTLVSERAVTNFTCRVLESGPVSALVRLDYRFAPQGVYHVLVRLDQDAPLAQVEEEFDFGAFTEGRDYLALDLTASWQPDAIGWVSERPFKTSEGLKKRLEAVKARPWKTTLGTGDDSNSYAEMPLTDAASEAGDYVHPWGKWGVTAPVPPAQNWLYLSPWQDWGSRADYISACRGAAADDGRYPQLGVLALHAGAWRRPSNAVVRLHATQNGSAVLEMPISCCGVMRPFNPFDSAEEDPSLPPTLGRRTWGLVAGIRQPQELRDWHLRYGMIGLDRYKDWILDWDAKDEMKPATYPRAYTRPEDLAAIKEHLEQNPLKTALQGDYLVHPDDGHGQRAAGNALALLDNWLPNRATSLVSHFRMAENDNSIVPVIDAALAWPQLPDDQRRELLAKTAAMCYVLTDPDFNPRGIGMHLGNPNMPLNRYMGFPQYANLLPSHPLHAAWMAEANRYIQWKLADEISPGGAWREEMAYQQAGAPHVMEAILNLRNGGALAPGTLPYLRELNRYCLACVCPPDVNEAGLRGCEGTGNGGRTRAGFPVYAANLLKQDDPELAGQLMWLWQSFGSPKQTQYGLQPLALDPTIAPITPKDISGAFLPGYGATARAHFGAPNETFLMLRAGYNQSHYDMDQGSFKFYAYGEQLTPNSSCGYNSAAPANIQHGIVSFGDPEWFNNHGRTDAIVVDHAYLDTVDHLLARQHFDDKSGRSGGNAGCKTPFDWYRQFLFLKSRQPENPSYLVLRDTFRGTALPPSHWHCWLNGKKESITTQGNRVQVTTPQNNRLELIFAEPNTITPVYTWKGTVGGSGCSFPATGATQVRVTEPGGQGYFVVLYPRKADMPSPVVESPAPGVLKITTPEGTDYVFMSPDVDITYKSAEVSFTGRAGAVRIYHDEVRLVLASGGGAVGYKDSLRRNFGPFEVSVLRPDAGKLAEQWPRVSISRPMPLWFSPLVSGEKQLIQPGVTKITGAAGFAYQFDSPTALDVTTEDGIRFRGRKGAVEVLPDRVRYLLQPDPALGFLAEVGYHDFIISGEGPYDLTFTTSATDNEGGEVTGVVAGRARVLSMPMPLNLVPPNCPQRALPAGQLQAQVDGPILTGIAPTLYINDRQWQLGYYDRMLALSVFAGENKIRITRFHVPPLPALPERAGVLFNTK